MPGEGIRFLGETTKPVDVAAHLIQSAKESAYALDSFVRFISQGEKKIDSLRDEGKEEIADAVSSMVRSVSEMIKAIDVCKEEKPFTEENLKKAVQATGLFLGMVRDDAYPVLKEALREEADEEYITSFMTMLDQSIVEKTLKKAENAGERKAVSEQITDLQNRLSDLIKADPEAPLSEEEKEYYAAMIVSRELGDAERNDRKNIDRNTCTTGEITLRALRLMKEPVFEEFCEKNREELRNWGLRKDFGTDLELGFLRTVKACWGPAVDDQDPELFGRYMSTGSSHFNTRLMKADGTETNLCEMLAIVDLCSADTIDLKHLSNKAILDRAEQMKKDPVFKEFIKVLRARFSEKGKPYSVATLGAKGEKLRDTLVRYIQARPDVMELDDNLYGMYKPEAAFRTYRDYAESLVAGHPDHKGGLNRLERVFTETVDEDKMHAARIISAYRLSTKKVKRSDGTIETNPRFNPVLAEREAKKLYQSPQFRILAADKGRLALYSKGEVGRYITDVSDLYTAFIYDDETMDVTIEVMEHVLDQMTHKGKKDEGSYLKMRSQDFVKMVSIAREFVDKYRLDPAGDCPGFEDEESEKAMIKAAIKVVGTIMDYQTGKEDMRGLKGVRERFDLSMQLLASIVAGTDAERYLNEQVARVNQVRGVS